VITARSVIRGRRPRSAITTPSARSFAQRGPAGLPADLVGGDQRHLAGKLLVECSRIQPPQQIGAELGP